MEDKFNGIENSEVATIIHLQFNFYVNHKGVKRGAKKLQHKMKKLTRNLS